MAEDSQNAGWSIFGYLLSSIVLSPFFLLLGALMEWPIRSTLAETGPSSPSAISRSVAGLVLFSAAATASSETPKRPGKLHARKTRTAERSP